jgi:ribonuclease M5
MFQEIFVVEGVHDRQKLESVYPGIECIVTNGSEIADATIDLIRTAAAARGVILFLDPDHPGRQITDRIVAAVPGTKIAFLPRRQAISRDGRKVGVEHASAAAIEAALRGVYTIGAGTEHGVAIGDLIARGLAGCRDAEANRMRLAERLGLPKANAKTLLKWLNMLGIPRERLDG